MTEESTAGVPREVGSAIADSIGSTARVIGVTGPPGSGKSTLTSALVSHFRGLGLRVAVLAVDPSSPFGGGALLGDRIRMLAHTGDDGVFIRSMASRGHLGGLAAASFTSIAVLMNTGFDVVLVETVGVGQSEVEVAAACDTTLVLSTPGAGDGIQAVKAGILEAADVVIVNKADLPGADVAVRQFRDALGLSPLAAWRTPVVSSVASNSAVDDVVAALDAHWAWLSAGDLEEVRRARMMDTIRALAVDEFRRHLKLSEDIVLRVCAGEMTVPVAVRKAVMASFA
ncbi:methylmalonyl Co-A mutase-associated GTPase MeaB [Nocardioides sp. cx-169]|nr:methylmalonyl Co-A mutase-associated GTPase MeaB [Nocardioides sp. cx-169]